MVVISGQGLLKLDYDFPCQSFSELIRCLHIHCADFWVVNNILAMVEHATCKDSSSNTENFKFHYCVPSDRADRTIGDDNS